MYIERQRQLTVTCSGGTWGRELRSRTAFCWTQRAGTQSNQASRARNIIWSGAQ